MAASRKRITFSPNFFCQAGENVSVLLYPARRSIIDLLMKKPQDDMLQAKLKQVFGRMPFRAWMKGGFLRVMPHWVEVR